MKTQIPRFPVTFWISKHMCEGKLIKSSTRQPVQNRFSTVKINDQTFVNLSPGKSNHEIEMLLKNQKIKKGRERLPRFPFKNYAHSSIVTKENGNLMSMFCLENSGYKVPSRNLHNYNRGCYTTIFPRNIKRIWGNRKEIYPFLDKLCTYLIRETTIDDLEYSTN